MKKLLLIILMIFPFIVSACSCDNFNMATYEKAVKNYNNSTGFEYTLTITKRVEGQNYYTREEYKNKYLLKTTGEVENFSSELKSYRIDTPQDAPESAPRLIYTLYRYYVGETNRFYTRQIGENLSEVKGYKNNSYDEEYSDINSQYNIKNLVPVFQKNQLTGFSISNIDGKDGYSASLFTAPVLSCYASDSEETLYAVTMDKNFYFYEMEFVLEKDSSTATYEYKFLNYNSDVNIEFPIDLVSYPELD